MATAAATAVVLFVLVATNAWVHLAPARVHMVTGPLGAAFLLLVGLAAGLTWQDLGLGRATMLRGAQVGLALAVAVGIGYAVAVAIPFTRGAFRDTRYRLTPKAAVYLALVVIPLGTVLFEEVAFRGVLWGLLSRDYGVVVATLVAAGIFGIWHVLPAIDVAATNTSVRGHPAVGRRRVAITVLATMVFTTMAGVVFAELRRRTGSLLAPIGLHWATNGLGVLAAARVWAITPGVVGMSGDEAPDASAPFPSESQPPPVSQPAWQRGFRRLWSSRP